MAIKYMHRYAVSRDFCGRTRCHSRSQASSLLSLYCSIAVHACYINHKCMTNCMSHHAATPCRYHATVISYCDCDKQFTAQQALHVFLLVPCVAERGKSMRVTSVSHAKSKPEYLVLISCTILLASAGVSTTQMSSGISCGIAGSAAAVGSAMPSSPVMSCMCCLVCVLCLNATTCFMSQQGTLTVITVTGRLCHMQQGCTSLHILHGQFRLLYKLSAKPECITV